MDNRFDRRIVIFAAIAVVCFALSTVSDDKLRHVPVIVGIAYVVLTALYSLAWLSDRDR